MSYLNNIKYRYANFSVAEKIIFFNVIFFIAPYFLNTLLFLFNIPSESYLEWFILSPELNKLIFRPWTIITYSFIHEGFFHLFWNMLLLLYISRIILNLFSSKVLINVYFLGIISGGLIFLCSYSLFPVFKGNFSFMGGSSAGVMSTIRIALHGYGSLKNSIMLRDQLDQTEFYLNAAEIFSNKVFHYFHQESLSNP